MPQGVASQPPAPVALQGLHRLEMLQKGVTPPSRDDIAVHVRSCLSTELAASLNWLKSELLGEIKSVLATTNPSHQVTAHGSIQASTQPSRPSTPAWNTSLGTGLTNVPPKRRLIDRTPPPAVVNLST
uniref:Uncharacterized protein n=1 Tax=Anopheles atroparvus TaxID=41427 RepID=A0A182JEN6_ANOAO